MSVFNKLFHTNKSSPKNTLSNIMSFLFGSTTAGQNVPNTLLCKIPLFIPVSVFLWKQKSVSICGN